MLTIIVPPWWYPYSLGGSSLLAGGGGSGRTTLGVSTCNHHQLVAIDDIKLRFEAKIILSSDPTPKNY
jgi:hypothetical protein